jgi:hypothetical protein
MRAALVFIGITDEAGRGFGASDNPEFTELHCVD